MDLHELRNCFSIIPQTPLICPGSIRTNLDPFNLFSEDQIWASLEHANLTEAIQRLTSGLDTEISLNQEVFSMGERQLLCLARAILKKEKILIMDEATSNIDSATDSAIQEIVNREFSGKTVIVVAHRILTIADCDQIIVMESGEIKEIGSPR